MAAALIAGLALLLPSKAPASELLTWSLQSPRVDPSSAALGASPKPGFPSIPKEGPRVNVLLPDGYGESARRYPVLYLLHGLGWGYDYWIEPGGGDLRATLPDPEAIVVMPEGGRGWYADWWRDGERRDPGWSHFQLNRVIRAVHRRLRVRPGRRWHSVAGFSMGGLGAFLSAAHRPDYFGSAASLSGILNIQRPEVPAFFDGQAQGFSNAIDGPGAEPETHRDVWGDYEQQAFWWANHNPTALVENLGDTRLYISVGDGTPSSPEDLVSASTEGLVVASAIEPYVRELNDDFLRAASAAEVDDIEVRKGPGLHSNFASRAGLAEASEWGFFGEAASTPTSWTHRTAKQRGRAWQFRFRFAQPPAELITFERRGRRLRGSGRGTVELRNNGCRLRLTLPFTKRLSRRCSSARMTP